MYKNNYYDDYYNELGNLMICRNCMYHDEFSWACVNGDSLYVGDFTDDDFGCICFAAKAIVEE